MKFPGIKLFVLLILIAGMSGQGSLRSQTVGNLTFKVTTKAYGGTGTFSPKNVVAIWLANPSGTFVRTFKLDANAQKNKLVKWVLASNNNVVDAITGVTLLTHQTHTITWNGRDLSGNALPDGNYTVWVEFTEKNSTVSNPGPSASVAFAKGTAVQHLAPADNTYFQGITLDWIPDTSAAVDNLNLTTNGKFQCFPNPFNSSTSVNFSITNHQKVKVDIFNVSGKWLRNVADENMAPGNHALVWDGKNETGEKVASGIYYIRLSEGSESYERKILLVK